MFAVQHKNLLWYLDTEMKSKDKTIELLKQQTTLLKSEKTSEVRDAHDLLRSQRESYEVQLGDLQQTMAELRGKYQDLLHFTQEKVLNS